MEQIRLTNYLGRELDGSLASEIGQQLWEIDSRLDFSGVTQLEINFVQDLLAVILERRDQTALLTIPDTTTITPAIMTTVLGAIISPRGIISVPSTQGGVQESAPELERVPEAESAVMNPFEVLHQVQQDYLGYVQTFQQFQNPVIRDWVLDRIKNGALLWKPPYIQLARPFQPGESLGEMINAGILHPQISTIFRRDLGNQASAPIHPHKHQSVAIRKVLSGKNVIVATGTGSGKSFAFGIPIVSDALSRHAQGVRGIQAVIIYPMNALANSQYDDFSRRLHDSGLRIALYTGDTKSKPTEAIQVYRETTGRDQPFDCEVLSREEIQHNPPDILMTNYVMLELLLTRFEDRVLFSHQGILRYLVLDEVHTYSGSRGADVAALIRRLKQHTGTIGQLRCIGTSATVESRSAGDAAKSITHFASELFGEPFDPEDVVTESYLSIPPDLEPDQQRLLQAVNRSGPRSIVEISRELELTQDQVSGQLLQLPNLPPKLHSFFSQGRTISACLDSEHPHLNDRGERECPICAAEGNHRPTLMMVFCRSCGQEFYSVDWREDGTLESAELDSVEHSGKLGYLLLKPWDEAANPLPDHWYTPTRRRDSDFRDVWPINGTVCPDCGKFYEGAHPHQSSCKHRQIPAIFWPFPFLFCPACGIIHDRRSREFNKLFSFGSVGRSTATDVIISAQVRTLPALQAKVIAFSDNLQDTALQAAHMNSLQNLS